MTGNSISQYLTINLNSLFCVESGENRFDPASWLNDGPGYYEPVFTQTTPLKIVDVSSSNSTPHNSHGIPSVAVTFAPVGRRTTPRPAPDVYVREASKKLGQMITSIDTLSRSIQLIDLDPRTVMDAVEAQPNKTSEDHAAVRRAVRAWRFDDLDDAAAIKARQLLSENVRRHEREHVKTGLNPQTALWNELEVQWRWTLLTAAPSIWSDRGFLGRFLDRYGIPCTYTSELLAILQEEYSTDDPTVQRAVEQRVAAHQGGAVGPLLDFFHHHNIEADALRDVLLAPVGQTYCDFWLAYVLDAVRQGDSLASIDADSFLQTCDAAVTTDDGLVPEAETRAEFVALFDEIGMGPVVEVVYLTEVDGTITLKRTWYSMNRDASTAECLLAVRRALFRRHFFDVFRTATGLNDMLASHKAAVERVIRGRAFADITLTGDTLSAAHLADHGRAAYESATDTLLGEDAPSYHLNMWLNDHTYGFDSRSSTPSAFT